MNTDAVHELLKVPEAAKLLRIGKSTAYALARKNQLPGCRMVGGVYRVSRRVLLAFIESGGTPGATTLPAVTAAASRTGSRSRSSPRGIVSGCQAPAQPGVSPWPCRRCDDADKSYGVPVS